MQQKQRKTILFLLSQWLTGFELLGIPYLVGKRKFKLFFRVHWLSEFQDQLFGQVFGQSFQKAMFFLKEGLESHGESLQGARGMMMGITCAQ